MIRFPTFHASSPSYTKTAQESLADILYKCDQRRRHTSSGKDTMVSSKGKPTDPQLREEVKEEVKKESKGGGPGSWSAWKAGEMARRYEQKGGDYEDTGDNKNKAQKGAPEKKSGGAKKDKNKK